MSATAGAAPSTTHAEPIEALIKRGVIAAGGEVSRETALMVLERKSEALPCLIEIVKSERYWNIDDDQDESWAPYTTLYLLSLTKATEALEAIIYAMYNYSEELGDWLTDIQFLLAHFGEDHLARFSELVLDTKLSPYARDAAARATIMIAESSGKQDLKKAAIECLKKAISAEKDITALTFLAFDLAETKDIDSFPLIKTLYDGGAVDTQFATFEDVEAVYAGQLDDILRKRYAMRNPIDFFSPSEEEDQEASVEEEEQNDEESSYMAFRCPDCRVVVWDVSLIQAGADAHIGAARSHADRLALAYTSIGRNESCPCGSGKKYKKCCLPQVQVWDIIDRKLDEGYDYFLPEKEEGVKKKPNSVKACECWISAWEKMLSRMT